MKTENILDIGIVLFLFGLFLTLSFFYEYMGVPSIFALISDLGIMMGVVFIIGGFYNLIKNKEKK